MFSVTDHTVILTWTGPCADRLRCATMLSASDATMAPQETPRMKQAMRVPLNLAQFVEGGTGSVSCNSVFVLRLCYFLNQEDLMEREAMVQNP